MTKTKLTLSIKQPIPELINNLERSSIYTKNSLGDNIPHWRKPFEVVKKRTSCFPIIYIVPENDTKIKHKIHIKMLGTFLKINCLNMVQWFILSKAFDASRIQVYTRLL